LAAAGQRDSVSVGSSGTAMAMAMASNSGDKGRLGQRSRDLGFALMRANERTREQANE
jgi:hypothetical protein